MWFDVAQVLSDPQKRQVYDQFGEDGLKNGGGMPGGFSGFPGGGGTRSADDIFAEVRPPALFLYVVSTDMQTGDIRGVI
jgi:DnaJ-class molecular chaperone